MKHPFAENKRNLSSFSEGVWGNRSLDPKERFPQRKINLEELA